MNQYPENYRFHLQNQNTLLVQGNFREGGSTGHTLFFSLDEQPLFSRQEPGEKLTYQVSLPERWEKGNILSITDHFEGTFDRVYEFSVSALRRDLKRLFYNIESCQVADGFVQIQGWALGSDPVKIEILDRRGAVIESSISRFYRQDVLYEYDIPLIWNSDNFPNHSAEHCGAEDASKAIPPAVVEAGFRIRFSANAAKSFQIRFTSGLQSKAFKTTVSRASRHNAGLSVWKRFVSYLGREGWRNTLKRIFRQLQKLNARTGYPAWCERHQPSKRDLERQCREIFTEPVTFSIVVPLYRTKESFLDELLKSIFAQTYPYWELCLADGSGREHSLEAAVKRLAVGDNRINYQLLNKNLGIAENTNAAIRMSSGDFVVLADHDDLLAPNALYECAKTLLLHRDAEVLYTDEDKIDMSGKTYFEPNFKPDFSPDYLRSVNYICHMFMVKRSLLERTGLLRQEYDGAQDYDFILRCCEQAKEICHIPRVLYHWRCHMDSTAANPESKLYAFEAGRRALEDHYKRIGLPATVENANYLGMYHTVYHWEQTPLISILIPNKDHVGDLKKCLDSIDSKSLYRNYEYIIIENNSTEEETFRYYEEIKKRSSVTVVTYQGGFNFSGINNFGEQYAKGEYLLLLNNDTEMMDGNCLQEMLNYCMREDVGIVGAKLWYEDDSIQHAGVVVGLGGVAGNAFVGAPRHDPGYQKRILCTQDYSAVTAACLMVKHEVFKAVGGLTEELAVAFNDVDFCLKVRDLGKLVVYNPYAELHHYESKSRGYEDTPEKIRRFQGEIETFQRRWKKILESGDPYYNPNLTLDRADFSLGF